MPGAEEVRLVVGSRVAWLETVTAVAEDLAERTGFDETGCFHVAMAIREALSNAMIHGNRRDEAKLVEIRFLLHPDRLEILVRDEGPGFDPGEIPDPTAPHNLLRASGRGVFLIKNYMDEVDLAAVSRRGGEIRMIKRRRPPGAGPTRGGGPALGAET